MSRSEKQPLPRWPDPWVLEVLRAEGRWVDGDQAMFERMGERTLWQAVVAAGLATDEWMLDTVARRYGLARTALSEVDPAMAHLLDEGFVRHHHAVPVGVRGRVLVLAASDPLPFELERAAAFAAGMRVEVVLAAPAAVDRALERLYPAGQAVNQLVTTLHDGAPEDSAAGEADAVRLLNALVVDACHRRASELHLDADGGALVVRYRVDGVLHDAATIPAAAAPALLRQVKTLAGFDPQVTRPQEGRAKAEVEGRTVELRLTLVTAPGGRERVVARLADPDVNDRSLEELGCSLPERTRIERMLKGTGGLVLVVGPPESGRTTTLYATIKRDAKPGQRVVTVEDPIDRRLLGATQVQVNERVGLTFPHALRSSLRQDPDTVLVGDLRDLETADLATSLALSGPRVLAAMTTHDAPSAIHRLLRMGLEPQTLARALRGVVAQRLVRRVCTACREPVATEDLPAAQQAWLRDIPIQQLYQARGCARCQDTGYYGRMALAEVAIVTSTVADAIAARAGIQELTELCGAAGMVSLWHSGLARVSEGVTTMEELLRALEPPAVEGQAAGTGASPVRRRMVRRALDTILNETRHAAPDDRTIVFPVERRLEGEGAAVDGVGSALVERPLVLVVDDDRAVRRVLSMGLEREGFRVDDVADGRAALLYLQRNRPRAMVLDLTLPRVDGIGVLQAMHSGTTPAVPVLVLTGQDDPDIEAWTAELGAADFLSKPVTPRTLGVRLRAMLNRAAPALTA